MVTLTPTYHIVRWQQKIEYNRIQKELHLSIRTYTNENYIKA